MGSGHAALRWRRVYERTCKESDPLWNWSACGGGRRRRRRRWRNFRAIGVVCVSMYVPFRCRLARAHGYPAGSLRAVLISRTRGQKRDNKPEKENSGTSKTAAYGEDENPAGKGDISPAKPHCPRHNEGHEGNTPQDDLRCQHPYRGHRREAGIVKPAHVQPQGEDEDSYACQGAYERNEAHNQNGYECNERDPPVLGSGGSPSKVKRGVSI